MTAAEKPADETGAEIVATERTKTDRLVGTHRGDVAINARLQFAAESCHLVSPFPAVGRLPEGFGVQIALVYVQPSDTYPTKNDDRPHGLGKAALDRIGHALGLTWDVERSCRLDDASDPHYCHWRAVGSYRMSDGQVATVKGEKELDAREGSAQLASKSAKQIAGLREHIMAHAETKARLRAIRSMGIHTAYSAEELKRPFACVRLVFTGETDDPALRQQFAAMTAASFLGAESVLYGGAGSPAQRAALPAPAPERFRHPPPPTGEPPIIDSDRFPGDDE